jgi:hypothetical protein
MYVQDSMILILWQRLELEEFIIALWSKTPPVSHKTQINVCLSSNERGLEGSPSKWVSSQWIVT